MFQSSCESLTESDEAVVESEIGSLIAEIEAENRRAQKWAPKRANFVEKLRTTIDAY